jgi:hypothetical protein
VELLVCTPYFTAVYTWLGQAGDRVPLSKKKEVTRAVVPRDSEQTRTVRPAPACLVSGDSGGGAEITAVLGVLAVIAPLRGSQAHRMHRAPVSVAPLQLVLGSLPSRLPKTVVTIQFVL